MCRRRDGDPLETVARDQLEGGAQDLPPRSHAPIIEHERGSDHTDRQLATVDIGDSKRACPKPVGPRVVEIADWAPQPSADLHRYVRRPYIPAATSSFDYPLTCRHDEPDSLLVSSVQEKLVAASTTCRATTAARACR
ncbi:MULTISPECIES: DUF2848 family protein [unclassified Rhodococcus (in: high G+C Gram-positive bacteria)]|uniref:DUF2848 family protein n=1 Tax=unclassified Rhodococcus (in: high G+C Gram-positive bacteria) TaxID=192944 RepID=UPI0037CB71EB